MFPLRIRRFGLKKLLNLPHPYLFYKELKPFYLRTLSIELELTPRRSLLFFIRDITLSKPCRKKTRSIHLIESTAWRILLLLNRIRTLPLPIELVLEIISYLSMAHLGNFSLINHEGNELANECFARRATRYGYREMTHKNGLIHIRNLFLEMKNLCLPKNSTAVFLKKIDTRLIMKKL